MFNFIKRTKRRIPEIIVEEGLFSLIKQYMGYIKTSFYILYSTIKIKHFNKTYTIESLINFVFYTNEGLLKPLQIKSEIYELLIKLKKIKPKYILEIGTANGGSLFLFTRIASENATIISIDLPRGKYGGGYLRWKIPLYTAFAMPEQRIFLIRASSHEKKTLSEVKKILKYNKLDILYIDGDHSYNGVKQDFEMYNPLIKKGGKIILHDIVPVINSKEEFLVDKFWNEIKTSYSNEEIVESYDQSIYGFGILNID